MSDVCLIVGAGDGTGAAVAHRFAREGFTICAARRNGDKLLPLIDGLKAQGHAAHGHALDARDEEQVVRLFAEIEGSIGPVGVCVFNVGGNVRIPIREMTREKYFKVWEMSALAGFLVCREAARVMVPRGRGTILMTGATASMRGGSGFAAFAGAKHALRALAQSMARELGPEGIHVAHLVVDGGIDSEAAHVRQPDRYARHGRAAFIDPEAIAEAYWHLHCQPRTAWTHEMDIRPAIETW
ncbi:SDR family oxidoreductase [Futiania mangrovi]|uniref:SDR family oxidoreductase n=1 Tax=Futiania mangrovi TaxID=2959716 RepID=A0A9J6PCL1_9PROT|nr:SDR family oxidoreductase [Futiania mangrovii]MCP1335536.1 SDR family oxidoreductase [Futiania mangrovii]